jgi:cell wall-associated NlpC family hydrolase
VVTGAQVVEEARKYLGTPFHHQGRLLGVGIDCVGLLANIGKTLGLFNYDNRAYGRQPVKGLLESELQKVADEIPAREATEGDLVLFWFAWKSHAPQHVGIITDRGILHTWAGGGKVVEHPMTQPWRKRMCGTYRIRGVEVGDG